MLPVNHSSNERTNDRQEQNYYESIGKKLQVEEGAGEEEEAEYGEGKKHHIYPLVLLVVLLVGESLVGCFCVG